MSNSATPWSVAHQAPLSMGLSRQEYWSGLPFPSPGDLPDPGIKNAYLASHSLAGGSLPTAPSEAHLIACVVVCCVLVAQSCLTLCNPMVCSPPGFSVHGILQARTLEGIVIPFSRGTFQPRDQTLVSCIAGRFFTICATGKS